MKIKLVPDSMVRLIIMQFVNMVFFGSFFGAIICNLAPARQLEKLIKTIVNNNCNYASALRLLRIGIHESDTAKYVLYKYTSNRNRKDKSFISLTISVMYESLIE